jgi:hypothetical protein
VGLDLVEEMPERWGVAYDRGKTLVWFELDRADSCGEQFGRD